MKITLTAAVALSFLACASAEASSKSKAKAATPQTAAQPAKPADAKSDAAPAAARTIAIAVTENGIEPGEIKVKKGEPLKLVVTRKTDETCATELVFPQFDIDKKLPLNQPVEIAFTPKEAGEIKYGCAMGMMVRAVMLVE